MVNFFIGFGAVIVFIIILFIIILFFSKSKGKSRLSGYKMGEDTKQTLIKVLWLSAIYLIILKAFSVMWPTAFNAWYGNFSEEFILSQLLLISMICILASKWLHEKKLTKLAWIPGIFALLLIITTMVKHYKPELDTSTSSSQRSSPQGNSNGVIPEKWTDFYDVIPGTQAMRIINPHPKTHAMFVDGYGNKYYVTLPGQEPVLLPQEGNKTFHIPPDVPYIDISAYKEKLTVSCTFIKRY